ncbi:acetyl-CoA carboxylase biotin carboxyl carrier protein subunit [Rhodovarius crocodyli]|uniref:Acetyl-CoA carboxylase biotin carboxyl carrier protein subunit n=1 Tax=Rhodovarius crocodyli TaxID=1979269 RepID=A0A437MD61_9PROT|nr:acetyl-CoA carboxylase biotin carboxyl carrier protein subunit [Rhodovarius crocodyli]RVT95589.1 acetyl-CoA carboxylase biotin carboxyl carrier protein subunit [Rhodovarius crocodyli]
MILSPSQIAELTALMRAHGVDTLEISEGADSIRLVAAAGAAAAPAAPATAKATAPGVGTFAPLACPGQAVQPGQVLGTIDAGLVRRPVTAPCAGTILRLLAEPGSLAGFGTPLFEIN